MKKYCCALLLVSVLFSCRKETNVSNTGFSQANNLPLGQSAHDLLSSGTYGALNIEIQYAPNMRPQDQSITNLISFLNTYLNKPGGINFTLTQGSPADSANVAIPTAASMEDRHRTAFTSGSTIAVYIYFADAGYTPQANVIGVAYRNTSIIVYEKSIQSKTGGFGQPGRTQIESGVMEHEFGHLLGLVNLGSPMVVAHEDGSNPHHCTNQNCLMYFQMESTGLMNMSSIPVLDANCVNDLRANGGK